MPIECIDPHSLGPRGGLVKFTIRARSCEAKDRISILFIDQMELNIPHLCTLPMNRLTYIRVAPMSKFVGTSLFILVCLS